MGNMRLPPPVTSNQLPSFTVLVCSRGRAVWLARALAGIMRLRYPRFEVLVVHDPDDPATIAVLAEFAGLIRTAPCAIANLAAARNIGARLAGGEIVAFIDDDAVPEPDWLARLAGAYATPAVAAAGGFIRDRSGVKFQYRYVVADQYGGATTWAFRPFWLRNGDFLGLTGTNFSARREVLRALGGFDERFAYFLEETDFLCRLLKAGGRIAMLPAAQVHHEQAASVLRNDEKVPASLLEIARSKAAYAATHGRPGAPKQRALASFTRKKRRQIANHLRAGRLGPAAAARLNAELVAGLHEGAALPAPPPTLWPATPDAPFHQLPAFAHQRLCVVSADAARILPALRELAAAGHEITLITRAAGPHVVSFDGGIWRHELPGRWFAWRARREIARVLAHRVFSKVSIEPEGKQDVLF